MPNILKSNSSQILMAVIIAATFFGLVAFSSPFAMDDAYISFTYSRNLAQGNGLTYNGMLVEGFSNPLWTLLITPFIWLNIDPLVGARFLATLAMLPTLYLTWQLTQRLFSNVTRLVCFLVTLILATNITVLSWTVSGLETPLFTFLVILIIYLETHPTRNNLLLSALAVLALILTRPEGIMLFPIVFVYHLIQRSYSLSKNIAWTLIVIIPFIVFILVRLAIYGYPLPNTAYAKLARDSTTFMLGANYISSFFLLRPTFTLLLVLSIILMMKQQLYNAREWWLIGAVIAAFISFAWYVGGDWMPYHRFLMPIVPLLSLALAGVLTVPTARLWLRFLPPALAICTIVLEIFFLVTFCGDVFRLAAVHQQKFIETGNWIKANTDTDTVIAVVDAGMLAYYSEREVIDIFGLNNVHISHSANKSDPQYVIDQQPLLVQLHAQHDQNGVWYDPDSKAGNDLVQNELFHELYEPAESVIDFPIGANWFIRRIRS